MGEGYYITLFSPSDVTAFHPLHFHPLQGDNCDSNLRLVVDDDDNEKLRLERVTPTLDQRPLPAAYSWVGIIESAAVMDQRCGNVCRVQCRLRLRHCPNKDGGLRACRLPVGLLCSIKGVWMVKLATNGHFYLTFIWNLILNNDNVHVA